MAPSRSFIRQIYFQPEGSLQTDPGEAKPQEYEAHGVCAQNELYYLITHSLQHLTEPFLFKIEVQLTRNIILAFNVQHSDLTFYKMFTTVFVTI